MRERGYYRVKRLGRWEIAYWSTLVGRGSWDSVRSVDLLQDHDFEQIDETRIDPEPEGVSE